METKEFDRWEKRRSKCMLKFVLINGVLAWGMPMFIVMTYFVPHSKLFVPQCAWLWAATGMMYGIVTWLVQERSCRKEVLPKSSAPAPLSENPIWKD